MSTPIHNKRGYSPFELLFSLSFARTIVRGDASYMWYAYLFMFYAGGKQINYVVEVVKKNIAAFRSKIKTFNVAGKVSALAEKVSA